MFLIGVFLFGLGDFSRTFLVWLVAQVLGEPTTQAMGTLSWAALLYMMHNLISAGVAYPIGHLGDRRSKLSVLLLGYVVGVCTNLGLAAGSGSKVVLVMVMVLSGFYIAVEETLEKAVAAELLPRELRSLGFGILACANAVGDMLSSVYVGFCLEKGLALWAFGGAAICGLLGVAWLFAFTRGRSLS
jgi:MFS family permease